MVIDFKSLYNEPLYSNSIFLMLNFLSISFFGFLFWIVAANVLSTKDVGLAISIISLATLTTSISRFGIDSGFIRHFYAHENRSSLYNIIIFVPPLISLLIAAASVIVIYYIPSLSFVAGNVYVITYIALIILMSINTSENSVLMALKRSDFLFVQNLFLGLRVIIILLFPLLGIFLGIYNVIIAFAIAYALSNIFATIAIFRLGKLSLKPQIDHSSIKRIFSYSIGTYFSDVILLIPTNLLPLIVLYMLGPEESAYFSIACSLSFIIWMIPQAISISLFVEGSNDMPLKDNTIKALKFSYILLIPVLIGIFLFGDRLLLLYDGGFAENSFELLKLFSISSLFATIIYIFTSIKKVKKDIKMLAIVSFLNAMLTLTLSVPFIKLYGINGIGYVYILANAALSIAIIVIAAIGIYNRYGHRSTCLDKSP